MSKNPYDVVIVGAGNAAFSAAHAAREEVERVCMLEKSPAAELGGNSYFTLGSFRTYYGGLADLRPLLAEFDDQDADTLELPAYTADDFASDMMRLTAGRTDPVLMRVLVENSFPTLQWLHANP